MKRIAMALAGGVALAAVNPVLAQEDNTGTFTGPRIEGLIGYDISRAGSSIDNDVDPDADESSEGLLYGVGAGYDIAVGSNAIVGAEAEFTDSTAKAKFNNGNLEDFGLGRVSTGRDLYIGARAGLVVSPSALVYVKGGYTNARFNVVGSDGTTDYREKFDTDGWRLGAGAELALNENLFTKLEYRYSNYSKGEIDFEDPNIPDSDRFGIDTDRHQIVAGVGMRF